MHTHPSVKSMDSTRTFAKSHTAREMGRIKSLHASVNTTLGILQNNTVRENTMNSMLICAVW